MASVSTAYCPYSVMPVPVVPCSVLGIVLLLSDILRINMPCTLPFLMCGVA
jgi:hypothetical protein